MAEGEDNVDYKQIFSEKFTRRVRNYIMLVFIHFKQFYFKIILNAKIYTHKLF